MFCPRCHKDLQRGISKTLEARPFNGMIRRRRECPCGHKFTTREMEESVLQTYIQATVYKILRKQLRTLQDIKEEMEYCAQVFNELENSTKKDLDRFNAKPWKNLS